MGFGHSILRLGVGVLMSDRLDPVAFRHYVAKAHRIARTIYDEEERGIILALIAASERMLPEKNRRRKKL
jgi:hypothetical protein